MALPQNTRSKGVFSPWFVCFLHSSLEDEDPLGPPPDFSSMIDSTQDGEMMNLNHMSPSAKRMKTDYGSIPVHSMYVLHNTFPE